MPDGAIDFSGLNISQETADALFEVDPTAWLKEVEELKEYYKIFGDRLPEGVRKQLQLLEARLQG